MRCSWDACTESYKEVVFLSFCFSFPHHHYSPYYEPPQSVKTGGRPSDYWESEILFTLPLTSQKYPGLISLFAHL